MQLAVHQEATDRKVASGGGSLANQQKEASSENKAALQIVASSETVTTQKPRSPQNPSQESAAPGADPACSPSPDMQACAQTTENSVIEQAQLYPITAAPETEGQQRQQAARALLPANVRRWRQEESEEGGYASSPGSTASTLMLKPLTPAQSGEHRLHDSKEREEKVSVTQKQGAEEEASARRMAAVDGRELGCIPDSDSALLLRWAMMLANYSPRLVVVIWAA